ncbi:MAG: VanZ family protein [Acidobacteriota bacterium]
MIVIFALSAQPGSSLEPPFPDYALHFSAYAVLGALVYWACQDSRRALVIAAVVGSLYGATDEIHQALVPGRDPSTVDWAADTLGAISAPVLLARLRDRMDRRRVILAVLAGLIFFSVPAIALLRDRFPAGTSLFIRILMAACPILLVFHLRHRRLGYRRIGIVLGLIAATLLVMYGYGLTFQEMLHLYEYGALAYLYLALAPAGQSPTICAALAFSAGVALCDESLQWLWPDRIGEIKDVVGDVLFAAAGAMLLARGVASSPRPHWWSLRAALMIIAMAVASVPFVWQVHSGYLVSVGGVSFLSAGKGGLWPPASVVRKEALAHVQLRNELYSAGRLAEASAENLILSRCYSTYMAGHRYSKAQLATLPAPLSPYSSRVPRILWLTRGTASPASSPAPRASPSSR